MPWDLQLSDHGDLVFGGNRDVAIVRDHNLLQQRMMFRLRLPKGSWQYDLGLGSEISTALHQANSAEQQAKVSGYAIQALRSMPEISIVSVEAVASTDPRAIIVRVTANARPSQLLGNVPMKPIVIDIPLDVFTAL